MSKNQPAESVSGKSKRDGKTKGEPKILEPLTIESVAHLIKTEKARQIVVMAGAGISTAAGIPDFRSPGTGLYDNLQKYDLPYPEAIFDISFFKENPEPFFALAKELYPGKFLPTLTHYFIALLHRKKILRRCFTQNIDTLERLAGLSDDMIVEAHGSFAKSKCLKCNKLADAKWMKDIVYKGEVPKCDSCKVGIVKPCITFFGESLPANFFQRINDFTRCDLLIVIGTSLQVQPFASLLDAVGSKTPRLLINLEKVGVFGLQDMGFDFDGEHQKYRRDAFYRGTCDDGVMKLAELCGWKEALLQMYEEGRASLIKQYGTIPASIVTTAARVEKKIEVEPRTKAKEEVDKLVKEFEDKIKIESEISEEVDQMIKEFEEKTNLNEIKSVDKELLNENERDPGKEKEGELNDKDNKEILVKGTNESVKEGNIVNKEIEEKKVVIELKGGGITEKL
ncbi:4323_t:CDS:2 [Funneliformis mosseae]|uniref:4323_t:CDS:1 n=1 Tax=Funneliformis mosseae TaxID=27381 RepID=A0A9N9D8J2_FUNMO|nr:4323_t:CDS:2 [Funneliformis mosseae]